MAGLFPAIHDFAWAVLESWIPGPSPGMTCAERVEEGGAVERPPGHAPSHVVGLIPSSSGISTTLSCSFGSVRAITAVHGSVWLGL